MIWSRPNRYTEQSDQGHRVSASKAADGWRYSAWAAPECPELTDWQWNTQTMTRERYGRGEAIPQRCPLLGIFGTAAEARARCESTMTILETA